MKHLTFLLLLFGLFVSSCGADDDEAITPAVSIVGTWDLVDFELYQDGTWITPDDTVDYNVKYEFQPDAEGMRVDFNSNGVISATGEYAYSRVVTENGQTEIDPIWRTRELWWIDNGSTYRVDGDQLLISDRTALVYTDIRILTLTQEELVFEGTIDTRENTFGFAGQGFVRYSLRR